MKVTGAFTIDGDADLVFTMFDPEGEARWAPGWEIDPVFPIPFRPETNAVFRVTNDGQIEVWSMLDFNPRARKVECSSGSGDVRVDSATAEKIELATSYGNVHVAAAEGADSPK